MLLIKYYYYFLSFESSFFIESFLNSPNLSVLLIYDHNTFPLRDAISISGFKISVPINFGY